MAGYDPVQGALAAPLRFLAHVACCFFFWALLLHLWPMMGLPDMCLTTTFTLSFWQSGFSAISTYLYVFYLCHSLFPGVSQPGGPRPHRIARKPQWPDKLHKLPDDTSLQHVVAHDAHAATLTTFAGTSAALTGEPAGRDIWTKSNKKQPRVDERLVQELASGGRQPGFNPHDNPNRYVPAQLHC